MKFKFCSDSDCPLWALAGLHALSSLPAPLFRTLLECVVEENSDDSIMEILKDTSLSSRSECARAATVIRWVLKQAWRNSCPGAQLTRDLLVLGAPRAHAQALADAADAGRELYLKQLRDKGFMINKVTDVSVEAAPGLASSDAVKLTLHTDDVFTGEQKSRDLLIEKSQAKTLLEELKKAYKKMEELDGDGE